MTARTPGWLVERLHAGDLPEAEAARVRARLAAEGGLGRLEALDAGDRAFREAHPPGPALAEIRRRAGGMAAPGRRPPLRALVPVASLAAAAAVAVLVLRVSGPAGERGDSRVKGQASHLEVFRRGPSDDPERLRDGATARGGDVLQLSLVAGRAVHAVVISIDGRGTVTRHWPESGEEAGMLPGGDPVPLPHAYALDDAPGFERFFLVTGDRGFPVEGVLEAGRSLSAAGRARTDRLRLAEGLDQESFLVTKESR